MENKSNKIIRESDFELISNKISEEFSPIGLEHYPFKIKWYNERVSAEYRLPFDENILAFVILSTPDMFDKAFIPFVQNNHLFNNNNNNNINNKLNDPIDECMKYEFNRLKTKFANNSLRIIHDFELLMPSRKPKVLVQTAAHVSGAAFYYKPDNNSDYKNSDNHNSDNQNSDNSNRMIGVCIHPSFGGWFAIRGVIVFTDVHFDSLKQLEPFDVIKSVDLKKELLNKFNKEWKNWSYRDIIPVSKKYSGLQIEYFKLKPRDRLAFLQQNLNFTSINCRQN